MARTGRDHMADTTRAGAALRLTGVAMLTALCLFSALILFNSHEASKAKGAVTAHRAAHVVATQFSWLFETSLHVLQRIETGLLADTRPGSSTTVRNLSNAVRDLPAGLTYAVYDAGGRLTHSSLPSPRPVWVGDRDYFRDALAGNELILSPMLTDRQTGTRVMIVARRLDLPAGGFAGVATVAIPMAKLLRLAQSIGLDGNSTIGLVRDDGLLLARAPPVGPMDLSGTALFDALRSGPDGSYETVSPADGVRRIVGYWRLDGWPVIAIAGLDRRAALSNFRDRLRAALLILLPVLFLMGWLQHNLLQLMRSDEAQRRALESANARSQFLLREVHHRVKNNLQTVASLIRLESHLPATAKSALLGRLTAMVAVHEAMYGSDQFEEICVAPYLERLITDVARSHADPGVVLDLHIAPIRLRGDRAMLLGLLVNELASNALKHAFAGGRAGRLGVAMGETPDGTIRLVVADDGPGYAPDRTPRGMGSRLIEAFAAQLGGTAEIDADGSTTVTVTFPRDYLPPGIAPDDPDPRPAHPTTSVAGERSSAAMRSSNPARSSSRT